MAVKIVGKSLRDCLDDPERLATQIRAFEEEVNDMIHSFEERGWVVQSMICSLGEPVLLAVLIPLGQGGREVIEASRMRRYLEEEKSRRAKGDGNPIERHAALHFTEHPARDLDGFTSLAGRREQLHVAVRLAK